MFLFVILVFFFGLGVWVVWYFFVVFVYVDGILVEVCYGGFGVVELFVDFVEDGFVGVIVGVIVFVFVDDFE